MTEVPEIKERGEYILKAVRPYIDERGKIENYDLPQPVNMIATITSKKGDIRANHYHPIQQQMCLVISGGYISVYKDLQNPNSQIKHQLVKEGDLSCMPPMVAHTMIFLKDTIFLNLVGGERDADKFGKDAMSHTIPYKLVKPEEAQKYLDIYKNG